MRPKKYSPKQKRSRAAEALTRLRQRWEREHPDEEWEGDAEPVVTPMFKAVEGGIGAVIEAIRAHDDDDARAFLDVYEQCNPTDRKYLSLESIAFAAGIGSLRLAEVAQTALFLYASAQTKMLISSAMPKVTRAIVKAATDEVPITAMQDGEYKVVGRTNGDVKAMELFGRISGIAPVPKGAQIAIQNVYGDREPEKPAIPAATWRTPEERLREIQDITEPKRLPAPAAPPISIGGRIDHMQAETVEILRGE